MTTKEIINGMVANGAELVKGVTLQNITPTVFETWTRLGLTLNTDVKVMRDNGSGTFEETKGKVIWVSSFGVLAQLRENPRAQFAVNQLAKNVNGLATILSGSTCTVIIEPVAKGQMHVNPFAPEGKEEMVKNDGFYYYIADIKLSEYAEKLLNTMALANLGINVTL